MILSELVLHDIRVLVEHLVCVAVTLYFSDVVRYLIQVSIDLLAYDTEHVVGYLSQLSVELVSEEFHACS